MTDAIRIDALEAELAAMRHEVARSREQLVGAHRLAAVGQLAASVAHEIRNPLTSIRMRLFSMQRSLGENPLCDNHFRMISEELGRLDEVLRSFLDLSRTREPGRRACTVKELLDKAMDLIRYELVEREISLECGDMDPMQEVCVDPVQLHQVLINLLTNAANAIGRSGAISMGVSTRGECKDLTVVISIRDTGPGIPEDVRTRLFEPFFSTKTDGTGLGLCIASRIMDEHGGRLELESTGSNGTSFAIVLPAPEEAVR